MNTITEEIKVAKSSGERVIRSLEKHSKVISDSYSLANNSSGISIDESYKRGLNKLSEHYGVDFNKL